MSEAPAIAVRPAPAIAAGAHGDPAGGRPAGRSVDPGTPVRPRPGGRTVVATLAMPLLVRAGERWDGVR